MKLLSYLYQGRQCCGVLTEDGIINIPAPAGHKETMLEILEKGPSLTATIKNLTKTSRPIKTALSHKGWPSPEKVKLLAPIPRPGKVLALAGNYSEHIKEASIKRGFRLGLSDSSRQTTVPRPFLKPSTAVLAPNETIPWPCYSEQIDYELELAIVIGRKIKDANPKNALDAIAGYTISNDVSARSVTFKQGRMQRPWDEFYDWLNGKWADGFMPMGPYLVTADEIEDVQNLEMELKVNGRTRQKANTSQMIYPVGDIVSFLSHIMTLEPGDVIATGTPAGVAVATGEFLKSGDTIECRIEKLGTLTNTLGRKPKKLYMPLKTRET